MESFLIIYSTQTGQAKSIAETISDLALKNKFSSDLKCISDYEDDVRKLNEINKPCVFVCSTTGDGEVPEMAVKAFNRLKKEQKNDESFKLDKFSYALLGLGDTNYTQFCNGPKRFHKLFQSLGANCFYGPRWADDGTGLENEVEPFIENLWEALRNQTLNKLSSDFNQKLELEQKAKENEEERDTPLSSIELTVPQLTDQQVVLEFNENTSIAENELTKKTFLNQLFNNNLCDAVLTDKKVITIDDDAVKTGYLLRFKQVNGAKFDYEPGHAIDIPSENDDDELKLLFKCLNLSETDIRKPINLKLLDSTTKKSNMLTLIKLTQNGFKLDLYHLFKYYFDIRANTLKKALIRMLAESCTSAYEKRCLLELCSQEGSQLYSDSIKLSALSLCDLFVKYKTCKPKVDYLMQFLQPLQSRSYTLASYKSPHSTDNEHEMEIVFNLVKFDSTQSRTYNRLGIATGYLSKLNINENFCYLKRTLQNFVLPNDCFEKPMIMIGPGTGITPFISFLRYKLANFKEETNEWHLYYGCRYPNKDFLYKNELLGEYKSLIKSFSVSFSRYTHHDIDDSDKFVENELIKNGYYHTDYKYVQDALKAHSNEISDLILNKNAYIYVCGDARNMAKDVLSCLASCLKNQTDINFDSNKYLIEMMSKKRYRQDVWS